MNTIVGKGVRRGQQVTAEDSEQYAKELWSKLADRYGELIAQPVLVQLLGYSSAAAFKKAAQRKSLPINVFRLPHRRGRFAFARDIAYWMASVAQQKTKGGDNAMAA